LHHQRLVEAAAARDAARARPRTSKPAKPAGEAGK
jgi:hypothetical protein